MSYVIDIYPGCEKEINKACKRNPVLEKILKKKMNEIISNPFHYKPLGYELKGERRVHILKSFVLAFKIIPEENTVQFLRFRHHDQAY